MRVDHGASEGGKVGGNLEATVAAPAPSALERLDSTTANTLTSDAVLEEHATRHRGATIMALGVAVVTTIAVHTAERRAPGYVPVVVAQVLVISTCFALLAIDRRSRISERHFLVLGFVGLFAILAVTFYTGVFSPAFIAGYVGIYYFGLGDSAVGAWTLYILAALGYLVLASLLVLGIVPPNESLLPLERAEPVTLASVAFALEGILALTFWLARYSRRATVRAMERLERERQNVRQREALLNEARADLERVLEAGRIGRLTDKRVGPFTAGEVIGRGGMGEVYRATDDRGGPAVALKVLHPHLSDRTSVERFVREATTASSIASRNIVKVMSSGVAEDGSHYIAMELLEGEDLAWHLRESRRLSVQATLDLVTQVASGLGAAEDAGIVHRDLKPQNLFYARTGRERTWKVLDFGVSKMGESGATLTHGGMIGTPGYMSPEQTRGEPVDHRTDVFALGAIAYRALTGRPAFTGPDPMATLYHVGHVQPLRPSDVATLDVDIDRVLALALAKDRDVRFKSANTLAAMLRDASLGRLDDRLRQEADALVASHPWGIDKLTGRAAA